MAQTREQKLLLARERAAAWYAANKDKAAERHKQYYETNKDWIAKQQAEYYQSNKEKKYAYDKAYRNRQDVRLARLLDTAKRRAAARGIPFSITLEDINWPDTCPVFGVPLDYGVKDGKYSPYSPSLDRGIPERGYVKGNVFVISVRANLIKSDATYEEIQAVADYCKVLYG